MPASLARLLNPQTAPSQAANAPLVTMGTAGTASSGARFSSLLALHGASHRPAAPNPPGARPVVCIPRGDKSSPGETKPAPSAEGSEAANSDAQDVAADPAVGATANVQADLTAGTDAASREALLIPLGKDAVAAPGLRGPAKPSAQDAGAETDTTGAGAVTPVVTLLLPAVLPTPLLPSGLQPRGDNAPAPIQSASTLAASVEAGLLKVNHGESTPDGAAMGTAPSDLPPAAGKSELPPAPVDPNSFDVSARAPAPGPPGPPAPKPGDPDPSRPTSDGGPASGDAAGPAIGSVPAAPPPNAASAAPTDAPTAPGPQDFAALASAAPDAAPARRTETQGFRATAPAGRANAANGPAPAISTTPISTAPATPKPADAPSIGAATAASVAGQETAGSPRKAASEAEAHKPAANFAAGLAPTPFPQAGGNTGTDAGASAGPPQSLNGAAPAAPAAAPSSSPGRSSAKGGDTEAVAAASAPSAADGTPAAANIALPATPAPAPVAHAAASAAVASVPAQQVAQAVSGVHVAAGAQGQVTIHLQPGDLGAVQVRIERAADGSASVTVQVEKAETLQNLQQDIAHLHQALDRAGLPAEQRQVTMHLAPPAPAASGSAASGGFADSGPGAGGSFQRGGQSPQQGRSHGSDTGSAAAASLHADAAEAPRWVAAGINITA